MNLFNKLPGFPRNAPGLERVVLRRVPKALWAGTLLACLPSLVAGVAPSSGSEAEAAAKIAMLDIYAIGVATLLWTAVLTVAIAAFVVVAMKGPGYVADAYPLPDADAPGASERT